MHFLQGTIKDLPNSFLLCLTYGFCGFLAHHKPKIVNPSRVKNMVNFSYMNLIRIWNKIMSSVHKQYVNFSLSNIKWEGRRIR